MSNTSESQLAATSEAAEPGDTLAAEVRPGALRWVRSTASATSLVREQPLACVRRRPAGGRGPCPGSTSWYCRSSSRSLGIVPLETVAVPVAVEQLSSLAVQSRRSAVQQRIALEIGEDLLPGLAEPARRSRVRSADSSVLGRPFEVLPLRLERGQSIRRRPARCAAARAGSWLTCQTAPPPDRAKRWRPGGPRPRGRRGSGRRSRA